MKTLCIEGSSIKVHHHSGRKGGKQAIAISHGERTICIEQEADQETLWPSYLALT